VGPTFNLGKQRATYIRY